MIDDLRRFDTCAVLNAIETFGVRLRNSGYAKPGLQWLFPALPCMIGYASTLRVKSSNPPIRGVAFEDRTDWWSEMLASPVPRIAVIQDIEDTGGAGSVAGEVHAAILQRLGCQGLVTNGSVRDLNAMERLGFACSARTVSPSHAYLHTVDHGQTVEICGLTIHPGDLLMADRHGLISIPGDIAPELPAVIERLRESPDFSLPKLREEVK
jgi:regulator of RNase E activity RraA